MSCCDRKHTMETLVHKKSPITNDNSRLWIRFFNSKETPHFSICGICCDDFWEIIASWRHRTYHTYIFVVTTTGSRKPVDRMNIKIFYWDRDSYYKDKTIWRPSYLYNVNPHTRKTALILKRGPDSVFIVSGFVFSWWVHLLQLPSINWTKDKLSNKMCL